MTVSGSYTDPLDFSFTVSKRFHTQASKAVQEFKSIKARQLVQRPGNRIDFFGGSESFALF